MKLILAPTILAIAAGQQLPRGNEGRIGSGGGLRGSERETCTLEMVSLLRIPGEVLSDPLHPGEETDEDTIFECLDSHGMTTVLDIDNAQKSALAQMIKEGTVIPGKTSLDVSRASRAQNRISLPPGKIDIKNRGETPERKLAVTSGEKRFLAVKVKDNADIPKQLADQVDVISDNIFGTGTDAVNLKSQLHDCSFGQVTVSTDYSFNNTLAELAPNGVLEVTINLSLEDSGRAAVRNAVTAAVESKLGFSLPGPFDYVMYLLEGCYQECGWAGYAYVGSWNSVYQGQNYAYVGVQVHELGHNFGLAHSGGLDGKTYSDHTGMMGNPLYSDEVGKMCFNPAKNWQLGWYSANHITVDPTLSTTESYTLVGMSDYENNSAQHPIVIKINTNSDKDYFVGFNRATGPNAENVEADNEVTIVQVEGGGGEAYAQSYLRAHLLPGEGYTIDDFNGSGHPLSVDVTYIHQTQNPTTADIKIKYGIDQHQCEVGDDCADDGIFCNGAEICDTSVAFPGSCVSSGNPCGPGVKCIEETQSCTACDEVKIELTTDNYAGETSWDIKDSSGTIVGSGNNYAIGSHQETVSNLLEGTYTFTIYDAYGDGICCSYGEGSYKATMCGQIIKEGGSFGSSEKTVFTIESYSTSPPTPNPTNQPTKAPTSQPTTTPTNQPTKAPTSQPTNAPTALPIIIPTAQPNTTPVLQPTTAPTTSPTTAPTSQPTNAPTNQPTNTPTNQPTNTPTAQPTNAPTSQPTNAPTSQPTNAPTAQPTNAPTNQPTSTPTSQPTNAPTAYPTNTPTTQPTSTPTAQPTTSSPSMIVGETGRVNLSGDVDRNGVAHVSFRNQYINPVVVAFVNTKNDRGPVSARVRSVTSLGCQIFIQEPEKAEHNAETVSYIVVESGRNTLEGDIIVEAGIESSTNIHRGGESFNGHPVQFDEAFSSTPVLLHSLMTHNNEDFMTSFVTDITLTSFKIAMEAAETGASSNGEDIGWIAFLPTTGSTSNASFVIGRGNDGKNDGASGKGQSPHDIDLSAAGFSSTPDVVVSINDISDSDGAWARGAGGWDKDKQDVYAMEDKTSDREQKHPDEYFGWAAFTANTNLVSISTVTPDFVSTGTSCKVNGLKCVNSNECCGYCTGSGFCA